jgi:Ni,Fe-hydrogenase I cytochrome b subunit
MESVYAWFGGRKLFFGLLLFVISTVLFLVSDKTDFDGWSTLVMWIFGIYAVGNVGEHLSASIVPAKSTKK